VGTGIAFVIDYELSYPILGKIIDKLRSAGNRKRLRGSVKESEKHSREISLAPRQNRENALKRRF
jgi:uncharacterized membrane protein